MGDLEIRFYLSIFWKRLPYFLGVAFSISAIGFILAVKLPPVYRATARMLAESPQIPAEMVRPTVSASALEQLQIVEQEISTRENLLALAKRLRVYGAKESRISDADIVDNMKARILFEQVPLDASRDGTSANVFKLSFDARDPQLAAQVVNELTAFMQNKNLDLRTGRAGDTMRFFDGEVARLDGELTKLEAEILRFKNANKDALPDSLGFRRNQQSSQQERLTALEQEEAGLRSRRANLVRIYENTGQTADSTAPVSLEQQMLGDLNRALSEQLSIFSEDSPNVVALRSRIAALQKSLRGQASVNAGVKAAPSALELQLSDIDERLAIIERERSGIDLSLRSLATSIQATPANETVLNALERKRDNFQTQYNTAIAKLAEASTGEQIEARSKGGRISVIEPAVAPQDPIRPKRLRIAALGVAGGIAMGLGLIVLLEVMNKSIRRPVEITKLLQRPPLAAIPYIRTGREKWAGRFRLAIGLSSAACALPALFLATQHYSLPINQLVEKLAVTIDGGRMM